MLLVFIKLADFFDFQDCTIYADPGKAILFKLLQAFFMSSFLGRNNR